MTKPHTLFALAGALVVVLAFGVKTSLTSREPATPPAAAPAAPSVTAPSPLATVASPAAPAVIAIKAPAIAAPTLDDILAPDAATDTLLSALGADDPIMVGEAVNALVARSATESLSALVAQDVVARPKAAPSILYGLGRLAAKAELEDRDAAVDRLLALMAQEKLRGAQESGGNLLQIYEALGDAGDPRAIAPLERELLDPTVGTAPKVVVVGALVALHAYESRPSLEQVATQLATASVIDTGFEAELRRDLLAVIREALVQLS